MLTTPMDVITTREATTIQPPPAADTTTVMGPAATSTQVQPEYATATEPATTGEPGFCFVDK